MSGKSSSAPWSYGFQGNFLKGRKGESGGYQIHACFGIKADIVIGGHFYVAGGFIMVICGHRSHKCWSSTETGLLIFSPGSLGLSQHLCHLLMSLTRSSQEGTGRHPQQASSPACVLALMEEGARRDGFPPRGHSVPYGSVGPSPYMPAHLVKHLCKGIGGAYGLLLPAWGKSEPSVLG